MGPLTRCSSLLSGHVWQLCFLVATKSSSDPSFLCQLSASIPPSLLTPNVQQQLAALRPEPALCHASSHFDVSFPDVSYDFLKGAGLLFFFLVVCWFFLCFFYILRPCKTLGPARPTLNRSRVSLRCCLSDDFTLCLGSPLCLSRPVFFFCFFFHISQRWWALRPALLCTMYDLPSSSYSSSSCCCSSFLPPSKLLYGAD